MVRSLENGKKFFGRERIAERRGAVQKGGGQRKMENGAFFVLRHSVEMKLLNDFGRLGWGREGRGDWGHLEYLEGRGVSENIDSLSLPRATASVQRHRWPRPSAWPWPGHG